MFSPPGLLMVLMALFRQHNEKLKIQSIQFTGMVKIPWYLYSCTPGLVPPLQVVVRAAQIGVISIPVPAKG